MTHSLKTRLMVITVCLIVVAVSAVTLLSVYFVQTREKVESDQMLLLLCETGQRNLDYYFNSVQKTVSRAADFIQTDLDALDALEDGALFAHMEQVKRFFDEIAYKTNGVLTYYYRIDPAVSSSVKGFWYTNLDGEGFVEHVPTDITLYDTSDTSRLVWFTVPKYRGESVWLPPYITDNLDVRVLSYNVPIYYRGTFVGVAGIEIDYSTMKEQVESIRLYSSGLAFLTNEQGDLFYHPRIDVAALSEETMPRVPAGLSGASTFFRYTYEGVEKKAAWLPLGNEMRLVVSVPVSEAEADWQSLVAEIVIASVAVLMILGFFTMYYTGRITRPLEELTRAAEKIERGHYDFTLDYGGNDEVGRLTKTFKTMAEHMNSHIADLNKRANTDALTSVKNKGAFTVAVESLQKQADLGSEDLRFAVGAFDCNDLKSINDRFGHDKGDTYLKAACRLICRVFHHSPVFRTGGDEFAVLLQHSDYENRQALIALFEEERKKLCAAAENEWDKVSIAMGVADYDPSSDRSVIDTVHRADAVMYADKRRQKENA